MINSRFLKSRISESELKISLSNEDFYTIRDFIYEKSGIIFLDNKKEFLETRINKRIRENNFDSVMDYYYFLKYDTSGNEFKQLMNLITINETKFYRDLPLLESFEKQILPEIVENKTKKGDNSLKILSAGCSTGEEPYTLAIILSENKNLLNKITPKIIAGDISSNALDVAKKGVYNELQLRTTPEIIVKKYFSPTETGDFKISPTVKNLIDFIYLNLSDFNSLKRMAGFDIIFCRNVMIYFDLEFKKKLVKVYYEILKNEGYLFLGHSESLYSINNDFKPKILPGTTVYKKL